MRISDWSSDVCSSDHPDSIASLRAAVAQWKQPDAPHMLVPQLDESYSLLQPHPKLLKTAKPAARPRLDRYARAEAMGGHDWHNDYARLMLQVQIGRASCRERVCQYV